MQTFTLDNNSSMKGVFSSDIPEYKRSSLCTPHKGGNAGVLAAGGANFLLFPPCLPRDMGLRCSAEGSGIQTCTSHKTGLTGRPSRTCTLSRNLSGTAPGTGRISPGGVITGKEDLWQVDTEFLTYIVVKHDVSHFFITHIL